MKYLVIRLLVGRHLLQAEGGQEQLLARFDGNPQGMSDYLYDLVGRLEQQLKQKGYTEVAYP